MRLVDADALMMRLADITLAESPDERQDSWYKRDRQLAVVVGLQYAEEAVKEAPTVGGWISVTESLPEPDADSSFSQMMLANLIYEGGGPCLINAMYDTVHGEWVHDMPITGGKITHWMPCPKPPQEDEEDD